MEILISVAAVLLVGLQCYLIWLQHRTVRNSTRAAKARLFLEISDRWTDVLPNLYALRSVEDFTATIGKYDDTITFMGSREWQEIRVVANFFEYVGVLVVGGALPFETIRKIVTVHPSDRQMLEPVVDYLRKDYRQDIYQYWDQLVVLEQKARKRRKVNPTHFD